MADAGKILLVLGVLLIIVGAALMLVGRLHLPGDIAYRSGNVTIFLPIATSIILSVVLTLALNFLFRQR